MGQNYSGEDIDNETFSRWINFGNKLRDAGDRNDIIEYGRLINENIDMINTFPKDYILDYIYGITKDEILFWFNFPNIRLTVHDLNLIPYKLEDLFQLGLRRNNTDLSDAKN